MSSKPKFKRIMSETIWPRMCKELAKDIKKGRNLDCVLDLAFAQFYFCGQFDNKIPVDGGREITKTFIEEIQNMYYEKGWKRVAEALNKATPMWQRENDAPDTLPDYVDLINWLTEQTWKYQELQS